MIINAKIGDLCEKKMKMRLAKISYLETNEGRASLQKKKKN